MREINDDDKHRVFTVRLNAVELKTIYNAVLIDNMSDNEPDPTKTALLRRVAALLDYEVKTKNAKN